MDVNAAIHHEPDPDFPGWWSWTLPDDGRFHGVVGRLLVRPDGEGKAVCRMFPEKRHANLGDMVHGGALLTFIDMAMFAGGKVAGADVPRGLTVDLNTHFVSPAQLDVPLDAHVELLGQSRKFAFFQGKLVQEGRVVAGFSGTLRKPSPGR